MNIHYRRLVFLACALTAGAAAATAAPCTNADFKGSYADTGTGAVAVPGNPLNGPVGRIGKAIADGSGNVIAHNVASYNGFIFPPPLYGGTYAVNADCTLTMKVTVPLPGNTAIPLVLYGVITNGGVDVTTLVVDPPGLPVRILFKRLDQSCVTRELTGTAWGLDMYGFVGDKTFGRTGRIVLGNRWFDGRGTFKAAGMSNTGGLPAQETITGT